MAENTQPKNASQESLLRTLVKEAPPHQKNEERVKVLVEIARLDTLINNILVKKLILSSEDEDDLLAEGKPLGSLMLRAKLARRLGIITSDFYAVIKILSRIRNKCAHSEERFPVFDNTEIKNLINSLFPRFDPSLFEDNGKKNYNVEQKFDIITSYSNTLLSLTLRQVEPFEAPGKEVIFR